MKPNRALLMCGGTIHDWRGVGDVMETALSESEEYVVERVNDDLNGFLRLDSGDYDVVVLYHTRGDITDEQMNALSRFVREGGGFVGVHGAAASFRDSPEFHALLGGIFIKHPPPRRYTVSIRDPEHPITKGLDEEFDIVDEMYTYDYDPRVEILATALWKGQEHPVVWTKSWGTGRVCFFALGHDAEIAKQAPFSDLLTRCARWAASSS
jgi:uncharacterized protein